MSPETLQRLQQAAGIGLSVALAGGVVWRLIRLRAPTLPSRREDPSPGRLPDPVSQLWRHAEWLVQLHWTAAAAILLLVVLTVAVARLLPTSALPLLLGWWSLLMLANFFFSRPARRRGDPRRQLVLQIAVDLVVLSGLLNASGGIESPLFLTYVFPVIIAAMLLPRRTALGLTLLACALLIALVVGEAFHLLPHVTQELFPHPEAGEGSEAVFPHPPLEPQHASYDLGFVAGKSLPLVALLLVTWYLTALLRSWLRKSEEAVSQAASEAILEHQRLEGMVQAAGVGMMVVEPGPTIGWFSRRAGGWLKLGENARGRPCPLLEAEDGCRECVALRALEGGRPAEAERRVTTECGGLRYYRHAAQPVRDAGGRVFQVVELVEDVTERKALEAEALHAGKLSVLGQLAAGLAHEIGNPLASLTTRLQRLEHQRDPTFLDQSLALLRVQIERIDRTVHNVSLFSRNRPAERCRWPVNEGVTEAIDLVRLDHRARLEQSLEEPSPVCRGVRDQIVQVLINLLLNAIEATPEGGAVRVSSRSTDRGIELLVRDSGAGIRPEVRDRLFEPFVTTKAQGVGLGLAISQSLVQAHGGHIEVASEPGHGTCLTVVLPAAEEASRSPAGRIGG